MSARSELNLFYPNDPRVPKAVVQLRQNSVAYLEQMRNLGCLSGIDEIAVLSPSESVRSAVFLVRQGKEQRVVKFALNPQGDNVDAIESWKRNGVNTPRVHSHGTLRLDSGTSEAHFIITDYAANSVTHVHIDGYPFLDQHHNENLIQHYGFVAGTELRKMQNTKVQRQNQPDAARYNGALIELVDENIAVLAYFGIDVEMLRAYQEEVSRFNFGDIITWAHNDYAPHNLLVGNVDSLELVVIDPDVILAHPDWDFAAATNRLLWIRNQFLSDNTQQHQFKLEREEWYYDGLKAGYLQNSVIDERNLFLHQVAQLVWKIGSTGRDEIYQNVAALNQVFILKRNLLNKLLEQYR